MRCLLGTGRGYTSGLTAVNAMPAPAMRCLSVPDGQAPVPIRAAVRRSCAARAARSSGRCVRPGQLRYRAVSRVGVTAPPARAGPPVLAGRCRRRGSLAGRLLLHVPPARRRRRVVLRTAVGGCCGRWRWRRRRQLGTGWLVLRLGGGRGRAAMHAAELGVHLVSVAGEGADRQAGNGHHQQDNGDSADADEAPVARPAGGSADEGGRWAGSGHGGGGVAPWPRHHARPRLFVERQRRRRQRTRRPGYGRRTLLVAETVLETR